MEVDFWSIEMAELLDEVDVRLLHWPRNWRA